MPIGADRRVALKNSPDCDDRILKRRNGDNSAAGAAPTFRCWFCRWLKIRTAQSLALSQSQNRAGVRQHPVDIGYSQTPFALRFAFIRTADYP